MEAHLKIWRLLPPSVERVSSNPRRGSPSSRIARYNYSLTWDTWTPWRGHGELSRAVLSILRVGWGVRPGVNADAIEPLSSLPAAVIVRRSNQPQSGKPLSF
jgi:hypothetical protein